MIQFENPQNQAAADAARLLASKVPSDIAIEVMAEVRIASKAARFDLLSPVSASFMRIVLAHLFFGRPLEFPAAVLIACLTDRGVAGECRNCGYEHPAGFTACALCGGLVGPGEYSKRMNEKARSN